MQIQYTDKGWIYKGEWQLIVVYENVVYNQGQVMWFACFCMLSAVSLQALVPPLAPKQSHLLICKVIVPGCFLHISSSFQRCVQRSHLLNKHYVLLFYFTQCCETDWTEFSQFSKHARTHTHTHTSAWATLAECLWQSILLTAAMLRYFYQHMNQQ